jgi:hypothetical protein
MRYLFLEGQTDYQFVLAALRHITNQPDLKAADENTLKNKSYDFKLGDVSLKVFDCGGISKIQKRLKNELKNNVSREDDSFCVICDLDEFTVTDRLTILVTPINEERNIDLNIVDYNPSTIMQSSQLNMKLGIFIYPNNNDNGCLETLLIRHYEKKLNESSCFQTYKVCSNLSITPENNPKIYFNLVIGALGLEYNDAFTKVDFSDELFEPILSFLKEFLS